MPVTRLMFSNCTAAAGNMLVPRIGAALRPVTRPATRCLLQRAPLPRNFHSQLMRQQRTQNTPPRRTNSFWKNCGILYQAHPYMFPAGIAAVIGGALCLVYVNYYYVTYIVGAFEQYPEPVAKELRKALWYTNHDLNPAMAIKYYHRALKVADEIKFDAFSKELIGIKLQAAALMEKVQQYQKAIDILEIVRNDNLAWIDMFGEKEGAEERRTRILGTTIGVAVKLAELYSNEFVLEKELAEERMVWAVETMLMETRSRHEKGLKPGEEGEWLSDDEMGAGLERLAHLYEERDKHYLAAPLFLQAMNFAPSASCHTAILMNNLSISLAQQLPPPNYPQPASRDALIHSARAWADKAIKLTTQIKPPERDAECDMGCAVATHNLGELAEMSGDLGMARKRFEEARSLARAIGFGEGVKNAEEGLRRIAKAREGGKT